MSDNGGNGKFWKSILGIGAALGAMKLYTDWKVKQFSSDNPPAGDFVTVEGVRLHYVRKGSGRPIVFLHGADGVLQDFTWTIFNRAARQYDTIVFDRPGHGYSERPPSEGGSPVIQAELIHSALQKLEVHRPVLVGHSWSGALVLAYALNYPSDVSGIVTLGGYAIPNTGINWWFTGIPEMPIVGKLLTDYLLVPVGQALLERFLRPAFYPDLVPPGLADAYKAFALRPSQFRNNMDDMRWTEPTLAKLYPRYGEIKVPVEIIHGESDQLINPEQSKKLHEAIPGSDLVVLPNVGHMIHYSSPEVVMDAIARAFERSLHMERSTSDAL